MRQRYTHVLTVYRSVESVTETDTLGNPLDDWAERFSTKVEAYPPSTISAGGTARTRAGIVTDADMVAFVRDPVGDDINPGKDHAVLERTTDGWADAYVVEHVRAITGRGAAPELWEVHLGLESGGEPESYQ